MFRDLGDKIVQLDIIITPELQLEGEARGNHSGNSGGKEEIGIQCEDRIVLGYDGKKEVFAGDAENSVPVSKR